VWTLSTLLFGRSFYGIHMSELPSVNHADPAEKPSGKEIPADAFAPVVDPQLVPGAAPEDEEAPKDADESG
jgi:hypothetical protein